MFSKRVVRAVSETYKDPEFKRNMAILSTVCLMTVLLALWVYS